VCGESRVGSVLRLLFVMEQPLGNRTYYLNLRRYVDAMPHIEAKWVEVTYFHAAGDSKPWHTLLPGHARGFLAGRSQVLQGLREKNSTK